MTQTEINEKYKDVNGSAFICDLKLVERNMKIIQSIKEATGVKVLIALKGSSLPATWDICREYLDGATSSGLYECRLAKEFSGDSLEVHTFSPSFTDNEIEEILTTSDHIVFNSVSQLIKYKQKALDNNVEISLRLNPEFATVEIELYNPCKPFSRFGVTQAELFKQLALDPTCLDGVTGIHVHAFCMNRGENVDELLQNIEVKFSKILNKITSVNLGGGHDVTLPEYDKEHFISSVNAFRARNPHITDFYIEPGYGILANTGVLVGEVVDIVHNGVDIAILNISASCHSPDIIEYGLRLPIDNDRGEDGANYYLLSSSTCLSGDDWGFYSFDHKLNVGDKITFNDAIVYSFVKSTHFNGIPHPAIYVEDLEGNIKVLKEFGYDDFRGRLG